MNTLLEKAVGKMRTLPLDLQEDVARLVLQFVVEAEDDFELTPEDREALSESLAQAERGEFANDERIAAIWAKCGL